MPIDPQILPLADPDASSPRVLILFRTGSGHAGRDRPPRQIESARRHLERRGHRLADLDHRAVDLATPDLDVGDLQRQILGGRWDMLIRVAAESDEGDLLASGVCLAAADSGCVVVLLAGGEPAGPDDGVELAMTICRASDLPIALAAIRNPGRRGAERRSPHI